MENNSETNKCNTTLLANMSIDPKFVELTADVLRINIKKCNTYDIYHLPVELSYDLTHNPRIQRTHKYARREIRVGGGETHQHFLCVSRRRN